MRLENSSRLKSYFVHKWHDKLCDIFAHLLHAVDDARIKPILKSLTEVELPAGSNIADDARLNVAAQENRKRRNGIFLMLGFLILTPKHASKPERPSPVMNGRKNGSITRNRYNRNMHLPPFVF